MLYLLSTFIGTHIYNYNWVYNETIWTGVKFFLKNKLLFHWVQRWKHLNSNLALLACWWNCRWAENFAPLCIRAKLSYGNLAISYRLRLVSFSILLGDPIFKVWTLEWKLNVCFLFLFKRNSISIYFPYFNLCNRVK